MKRTWWRLLNVSGRQFFLEFVLRKFKTIELDDIPQYTFSSIAEEEFANITLPEQCEFFVMIKPSGLHRETEIKEIIAQHDLIISREETYNNFFDIAFHTFHLAKIHDYRYALPEGYIWLALLEHFYPRVCQQVKIFYIRDGSEHALFQIKKRIRRKIGVEFYQVQIQHIRMVTCMTPVHTSDKAALERELRILQYFRNYQS